VEDSAVRRFRSPRRVEPDGRNHELAALVANVPGAIYRCALDRDWTMAVISDEIERISGYPAADFVQSARRTFGSIIHPDDRELVHREVRAATEADHPFALEYRIVRADGALAWVLERGQRVLAPSGEECLHGVIFDITERKHAEAVLRAHAAEQARVAELKAARARIIAAQDATRRRIERDLHDGAQQRLVSLALALRMARASLDEPQRAAGLIDEALRTLAEATDELRELARGLHPAVLTDKGLPDAVGALAGRSPVPVEVECDLGGRLPEPVEAAAYYVVAEALTNVARYAGASSAAIRLGRRDDALEVEIADDGAGGADPAAGSGLRGLADRVESLDGCLDVESEAGRGTRVRARIPLGRRDPRSGVTTAARGGRATAV
jgi:PAS domain S-box-containing protein